MINGSAAHEAVNQNSEEGTRKSMRGDGTSRYRRATNERAKATMPTIIRPAASHMSEPVSERMKKPLP